jgi:hypothetical protein
MMVQIRTLFFAVLLLFSFALPSQADLSMAAADYDKILYFPSDRYPETADHIQDAIAAGHPDVCTIDRDGADERREEALKDYPPKEGYDRDEWPMAMCEEGGAGSDVRYIDPSDNRGAGAWVGNQLEDDPDGTRVKFIVQWIEKDRPTGAVLFFIPVCITNDQIYAVLRPVYFISRPISLKAKIPSEGEWVAIKKRAAGTVDITGVLATNVGIFECFRIRLSYTYM